MDLAGELRAAAFRWPMEEARLVRLVGSGRAPRSLLRAMSVRIFIIATRLTGYLARLAVMTDDARVRLHLINNLLEESGIETAAGNGLVADGSKLHLNWARTFALACGIGERELWREAARGSFGSPPWVEAAMGEGDWIGATSFLMAEEMNAPRTLEPMMQGLLAAGFEPPSLIFFANHLEDDTRHGEEALRLLGELAAAPASRERVLRGLREGADAWWRMHN